MKIILKYLIVCAIVTLADALAMPANAAFPGTNGRIAFLFTAADRAAAVSSQRGTYIR